MPVLHALQHLFTSVERGYSPGQGRGFQTVAVSVELVGSADLPVLERACYYALTPERRGRGDLPVKETFFSLPSGKFALGLTRDYGTDALGRDGNYLAYHLVFSRADLLAVDGDPFRLFAALPDLGERPDLKPRNLPAADLNVPPPPEARPLPAGADRELLASVAAAAVDRGERTVVLVGDEKHSRRIVAALYALLPTDERLDLTFSSHFYASESLRSLFSIVTAGERSEAPGAGSEFLRFDLSDAAPASFAGSPYGNWLRREVLSGNWNDIRAVNTLIDQLRVGRDDAGLTLSHLDTAACGAVWDRAHAAVLPRLLGQPDLITRFVAADSPVRGEVAVALLPAASPTLLVGEEYPLDQVQELLDTLKRTVPAKAWRDWTNQWKKDTTLIAVKSGKRQWWHVLVGR